MVLRPTILAQRHTSGFLVVRETLHLAVGEFPPSQCVKSPTASSVYGGHLGQVETEEPMRISLAVVLAVLRSNLAFARDLPDKTRTPGVANPAVTQDNIDQTIAYRTHYGIS